jgi:adenylate kinase family enzyme
MRSPLLITTRLITDAELYAPGRKGSDAVEWILEDYPRRVREVRLLRSELQDLACDRQLDQLLADLRAVLARYSI